MNIKSLLLGSAAALVAVSGARAADAVMAEPEAVEYVRVCDAYGAGFFYIPGTETCLKIGGWVRYRIDFKNGDKGWRKVSSAEIQLTAKSDTELGTLTSYIAIGGGTVTTNPKAAVPAVPAVPPLPAIPAIPAVAGGVAGGNITLVAAYITLGGLKMGYHDTLYDGGLDGEGAAGGGAAVNQIGYTFAAGAVSATLSLEEETDNLNYVPNIVGKVSFTAAPVGVDVWVAYDDADGVGFPAGFSVKGRVSADVGTAGKFKLLGTYNNKDNFYANGGKWTLGASYAHTFSPKLTLTGLAQYTADTNYATAGAPSKWLIGAVADYTIVPNFAVKTVVNYAKETGKKGAASGWIRFQRSF